MVKRNILAEKIKKAIKKTGLTQTAFEKKYNISENLISSWIHGKRNPSITSLNKIAEATKIPLEYFLEEDDVKNIINNNGTTIGAIGNNNTVNIQLQLKDHEIRLLKIERDNAELKLKIKEMETKKKTK